MSSEPINVTITPAGGEPRYIEGALITDSTGRSIIEIPIHKMLHSGDTVDFTWSTEIRIKPMSDWTADDILTGRQGPCPLCTEHAARCPFTMGDDPGHMRVVHTFHSLPADLELSNERPYLTVEMRPR